MAKTRSERLSVFLDLVKLRMKRRFTNVKGEECKVRVLGYEVSGFSFSALEYLFREVFSSGEYFFETSNTKPVIIDCGSNIGMSVLYFKYLFHDAKIMAFEPNPNTFRLLQKNMEVNGIRDVELHDIALSDREGEISFFVSSDPGTLLGSTRSDRGDDVELKTKADKLSKYIRNQQKIDLVKIDVEGSELNIVNELIESSALQKAEQYIIEYHHRINNDPSALADFLKKFEMSGYDYNLKASFRKPGDFQDVLVHFYKEKRIGVKALI